MLHLPTILLFTLLLMLATSAVFALMERVYRYRPGLRHWLVGCLLVAAGHVLRLIESMYGEPLFWWAGLCFLSGNLVIWLGILKFCRLRQRIPTRWIAPAFLLIWAAAALLPREQQVATNFAMAGIACGLAGYALLHARELEERLLRLSVANVYLLSGGVLLVRGLVVGIGIGSVLGLEVDEVSAFGSPASTTLLILRCFALLVLLHADQERLLKGLATTDVLTGLLNRQGFFEHASRLLGRHPGTSAGCVLMMDLDHFKQVNDRYGHAAGDAVLRRFANVLRRQLRPGDCAGRIGGEEFSVLLAGISAPEACEIAERVRCAWQAEIVRVGERQLSCSVSIGVGNGSGSLEDRLSEADAALYRAKADGRNRVAGCGC